MESSELVPHDVDYVDYVDYSGEGNDADRVNHEYYEQLFAAGAIDIDDLDGVELDSPFSESELEVEDLDFSGRTFLDLDDLAQLIDDLTYELINLDAPEWFIQPQFKELFTERSDYDSVAACSPLSFAPDLLDTLVSPEPPSIEWFLSLPVYTEGNDVWAVYVVVMEKPDDSAGGNGPAIGVYIGSGTDGSTGVARRLEHYVPGCEEAPVYVKQAFAEGYHVAHQGLLCWTPLPSPCYAPRVRGRFLAIEALFACLFYVTYANVADMYFAHMLLWQRDVIPWRPLCTHLPLKEGIRGDTKASPEELEFVAALKARDPAAYRAYRTARKNASSALRRVRINKIAAKVRAKNKALSRFRCDDCEFDFQSQAALDSHLNTKAHADKVAGVVKKPVGLYAANTKAARARNVRSGMHVCLICDPDRLKPYPNLWSLDRHRQGTRHIAKAKKAREALATQSEDLD
ncbi:hypothetical protein HBI26_155130 [Parastagonospora nodorum]|nr:hypothetical protein HBH51_111350 [Parastagonospora nodorum]KAH4715340.1 hypothetical protein HBH78_032400 [Parastagonospora nodorum]KAH4784979.1 hypothetical protein HBH62_089390 [Parastagonospora nodorum]KAH4821135.1 hypothetical protein HBH61_015320 [Parastagonospora nodorum]KAH4838291.1 hypothetical protein HBH63_007510 [Parastagonospora nodorum]